VHELLAPGFEYPTDTGSPRFGGDSEEEEEGDADAAAVANFVLSFVFIFWTMTQRRRQTFKSKMYSGFT
jgi:hypothetical protein